jgi:hypothetical protein
LPSAIGIALKTNSIELVSVHAPALTAEDDSLGMDRSDTLDVDLTARFAAALLTALVTALVTALFTTLFGEPLITRKLPLARDTSAKPTARDKTPNPIRHFLRTPAELTGFDTDVFGWTSRGRWVDIPLLLD